MELRVIYQGILNMLKRIKAYGPESMGVLSEHFLATLKHKIKREDCGDEGGAQGGIVILAAAGCWE